jgi:hypothetical protein
MNLEKLNLVELNAQEVKEVVGGDGIFKDVVDFVKELDANWDNLKARFRDDTILTVVAVVNK